MNKFEEMRAKLKGGGVQIAVAPLLYVTPQPLAARMVQLLNPKQFDRILEPSAGTGALVSELDKSWQDLEVICYEINAQLVANLQKNFKCAAICEDFLNVFTARKFDGVIMNPPFNGGADIKHIMHALDFLKPGGRLVAICANGPRQRAKLKDLATHWEDLPPGTFAHAGTNVSTALLVIDKAAK